MRQDQIDAQVFDLYDEYCHGHIDRRQFFERRCHQLRVQAGGGRLAQQRDQACLDLSGLRRPGKDLQPVARILHVRLTA